MKTFINTSDFSKSDYIKIINNTKKLKNLSSVDRRSLCPGVIVGSLFFEESVRTSSLVKAAILKLGGNYIDIPQKLTEDHNDVVKSLQPFCDLIVLRSKQIEIEDFRNQTTCPIINALCGTEIGEHPLSTLWQLATYEEMGILHEGIKIGIYGQTLECRPYLALQKVLAHFGAFIFHDPILQELQTPSSIIQEIEQIGGKYMLEEFDKFINKIDVLLISDGIPARPQRIMNDYAEKFETVTRERLMRLSDTAKINYMMPRNLTNGRKTVSESVDDMPQLYNDQLMQEAIWATMGLYVHLLGITL